MSNHIHPLVMATIEEHRARRELELERLRSARNACTTASPGGQSRAMALGKKIREVESIAAGWRLAMATLSEGELTATEDEMHDAAVEATEAFQGMVQAANRETEVLRVVGSKASFSGRLRCVSCTAQAREDHPQHAHRMVDVTSEDLPDGGMCDGCGADVLA